jgi:hypothetical protein
MTVKCNLRFDTPPIVLADWLHEHGVTLDDLERWYAALFEAFLQSGGLDQVPEGIVVTPAGKRGRRGRNPNPR